MELTGGPPVRWFVIEVSGARRPRHVKGGPGGVILIGFSVRYPASDFVELLGATRAQAPL